MVEDVRTYSLRLDEAERRTVRTLRIRVGLFSLLVPVGVGALLALRDDISSVWPLAIIGPVVFLTMWVQYRRALAHELATARSFRLAISPSLVRRVVAGTAPLEVARGEVTKIVEWPGRGIEVHGRGRPLFLVPDYVEGYGEVRDVLLTWSPAIETGRASRIASLQAVGVVVGITMVASWFGTGVADVRVGTLALVSLCVHLGVFGWMVGRDPNVTARQKAVFLIGAAIFVFTGISSLARTIILTL